MKRKNKIILRIISLAFVIVLLVIAYLFRPSPKCVCNKKSTASLLVKELITQYEADEEKANSFYLGKIIDVEGKISSISFDKQNRMIVEFESQSIGTVSCTLCEKESNPEKLNKGNVATIKGECAGYAFDVVLIKCCLMD